jgi:hypothetical protein
MASPIMFGGLMNRMLFGIPYYGWTILLLLIMGMIAGALWYFFVWWKLSPYHGVLWATIKKTGASFVFNENMDFDLITDRSSKTIFNETFKEAQEAENDHTKMPAATIGKVHMDFIFDPEKWTYPDSYNHKLIEIMAEKHNLANPTDQVRTLVKFARYLHEGRFDGDVYKEELSHLNRTYHVPWARIQMMYKNREESDSAGFVLTLANLIRDIEQETFNHYGIYILALFGVIDIAIIAAFFLFHKAAGTG